VHRQQPCLPSKRLQPCSGTVLSICVCLTQAFALETTALITQAAGAQAAALPPQQEAAALQRYRAQIWQQQRQVSLMGGELKVLWAVVLVCSSVRVCHMQCCAPDA